MGEILGVHGQTRRAHARDSWHVVEHSYFSAQQYRHGIARESLEIPGVAFIKAGVRQNLGKRGVRVHALRIELLDGTGLVLNVGTAKAKILR